MKVRAEAMQLASELTPSGMMTVMYGPDSRLRFACSVAKEFCQHKDLSDVDCRIASYLYPHCKVIAGNEEASDAYLTLSPQMACTVYILARKKKVCNHQVLDVQNSMCSRIFIIVHQY